MAAFLFLALIILDNFRRLCYNSYATLLRIEKSINFNGRSLLFFMQSDDTNGSNARYRGLTVKMVDSQ